MPYPRLKTILEIVQEMQELVEAISQPLEALVEGNFYLNINQHFLNIIFNLFLDLFKGFGLNITEMLDGIFANSKNS